MILVTGATGHLGQWVVAELARRGHEVIGVARRPSATPAIAGLSYPKPVRPLACDLSADVGVEALWGEVANVTAVVHLAAHIPPNTAANTDADARATLDTNALGTARLLGVLSSAPRLEAFIYASTFEVYGRPTRLPIDEGQPTAPTTYYGATKLAGEKYTRLFGTDRGVRTVSLRLPAIYGPGDTIRRALGNFVRAAASGARIEIQGDGADLRGLVYAKDAAEAVALAIETKAEGVFNIANERGVSILEMAETALRAANRPVDVAFVERVKPRTDFVLSIERAREALGWSPHTSLEDGVRAQLEWARRSAEPRRRR